MQFGDWSSDVCSSDLPGCKINWRFTTEDARSKLKKLYPSFED